MWLESHGWESQRQTRKDVLEFRDHTNLQMPLQTAARRPCRDTPPAPLSPQQLPGRKRNYAPRSSDSTVTREPESALHTKEGETQAGCKLFESFVRRGIFPVKFFFSFLKFVSKEREQERSHEF